MRRKLAYQEGYDKGQENSHIEMFPKVVDAIVEHWEYKEKVMRDKLLLQQAENLKLKAILAKLDPKFANLIDLSI
jgi:hypothetical protein